MLDKPSIADITHVIQLAVAPVFLLTAVATLLNVLINRLGRAVDRRRVLEESFGALGAGDADMARVELRFLERRIRLVYAAISLAVVCALFVCLLIASAFLGAFIAVNLSRAIAAMFVLAMIALIGSLVVFLREIFLAVLTARPSIVSSAGPPPRP